MSPELTKYYENRLSMMGEEAWQDLMDDVQAMLDSTNDITSIQDEKTLHSRRGEIRMMRWMLALKENSFNAFNDLKAEDEAT